MSTDSNVPKRNNRNSAKFAALAGILAFGLLASSLIGSQMLNTAIAQTSENGGQRPVTTRMDDNGSISAPSYHGLGTSTVSSSGTATVKVQPDKFSATVGVETNGTTAEEAASNDADLVAAVIAALVELGIEEEQISTSQYSVYPVYSQSEPVNACRVMEGYPVPPECYVSGEVVSYKAVNTVTVTLDVDGDLDAGEVIDAAVKAGANNVNGAYFFISAERQEEIRDSLIGDAIASARHRADIAAEAVGMSITGVRSINLNGAHFPVFGRGLDAAESTTPVLPGQQEVSMTVSVAFHIGSAEDNGFFGLTEPAMEFFQSKLPELGIVIDDELGVHMDMIAHISGNEYHVDFGVVDVDGQVHDGHIEVMDGEVVVAILDGESVL